LSDIHPGALTNNHRQSPVIREDNLRYPLWRRCRRKITARLHDIERTCQTIRGASNYIE
jgi:hypothetical protein